MIDINNVKDQEKLLKYAEENPSLISTRRKDNLVKFSYTQETQNKKIWNEFTTISRGLIINEQTHQVVAHPFNKFFNEFEYKEMEIVIPLEMSYWVTEKIDGTLIIPFEYKGKWNFSTRGEFDNAYVRKARDIALFDSLEKHFTYMFELIGPSYVDLSDKGFLVTKYEKDDLILVGMRDHRTGKLVSPPDVVSYAQKNGSTL